MYAPTPMKKAWPSETWPETPVSRFSPSAATTKMTAWVVRRIQSSSPRKRTTGIWLMTGRSNGSSTASDPSSVMRRRCVHVGKIDVSDW